MPSHVVPTPHAVPAAEPLCERTPAVHTSSVQGFLSSVVSRSSSASVIMPAPSHCLTLQSPALCAASTVFAATGDVPHLPLSQVRERPSLPVSGQSAGAAPWGIGPRVPPAPPPPPLPP